MTKKKSAESKLAKVYHRHYNHHVNDIKEACFVAAMNECPDATLKDVIVLAEELGIEDRVTFVIKPKAVASIPLVSTSRKVDGAQLSTRTPADRLKFDEAIRAAIQAEGTWVRAESFRQKHFPGAAPLQLRKAVNRLIRDGKIEYRGQARGTEYKAA